MSKRIYTEEEIEYLKNNYGKISVQEIADKFNRTYISIVCKAHEVGISNKRQNTSKDKQYRTCIVCKKVFEKTPDNFTSFKAKRDGVTFVSKCKKCERIKIAERYSNLDKYIKSILQNIKKNNTRTSKGYELDFDFIMDLYNKQEGKCEVTGIEMTHVRGKGMVYSNLSIDRIDSSKGYLKNNVQLICFWANWSKSSLDYSLFKELINKSYKVLNNE